MSRAGKGTWPTADTGTPLVPAAHPRLKHTRAGSQPTRPPAYSGGVSEHSNTPVDPRPQPATSPAALTSLWPGLDDPEHSYWYAERFRALGARGEDIHGESRLMDVLAPRHGLLLDAGCGSGRHGGHLARVGHRVVGVDIDPRLIEAARQDHPGALWLVGDLTSLDVRAADVLAQAPEATGESLEQQAGQASVIGADAVASRSEWAEKLAVTPADRALFDGALLAGNVLDFIPSQHQGEAVRRVAAHLRPGGFALVGCRVGRGFDPADLDAALPSAGLVLEQRFATWDLQPWDEMTSDFCVSILRRIP